MIKSVEKALRLLEILSNSADPMRLRDISEQADLTRSNALRLLQTLRELGYVRQIENSTRYEMTLKTFEIGARRMASDSLVTAAHPVLQRLAENVPHNVLLSVRDGLSSLVIDRIESRSFVRTFAYLGARAPLHVVSGGKLLLAFAPEEVIQEAAQNLTKFTENTITDPDRLYKELSKIRETDVATAFHEVNDAAQGVSVPVRSRLGEVVAALGISGPFVELDAETLDTYTTLLKEHATQIEAAWSGMSHSAMPTRVPRPSKA
jgi:DNA-binding IclR family transcriptional regulator